MPWIIGCDPGKTGAIVGYDGTSLKIIRMPHGKSAKGRGEEILYPVLCDAFNSLFVLNPHVLLVHAFIERVQAMPKEGASSGFKFGYNAGFLRGIIAASQIPITLVEPLAWKKTAGLPHGADKECCIARACDLWPKQTEELMPKRGYWDKAACIGVGDAALIAYHGWRTLGLSAAPQTDDNEFDI